MKRTFSSHQVRLVIGIFVALVIVWWGYHRFVYPWWYGRGRWYFENRRAQKLVREDPYNPQNWILLGRARYWTRDRTGSLEAYHRAWEFDTNDVDRAYAVAFGMRELGREAEAAAWFSNIVEMCERKGHSEWAKSAQDNLWIIRTYWMKESGQPDGPANRRQPTRPETNSTSRAGGSRR
jgi:hypothetical protein